MQGSDNHQVGASTGGGLSVPATGGVSEGGGLMQDYCQEDLQEANEKEKGCKEEEWGTEGRKRLSRGTEEESNSNRSIINRRFLQRKVFIPDVRFELHPYSSIHQ